MGRLPGTLIRWFLEELGNGGFGWNPIFVPEGQAKTFAEMASEDHGSLGLHADGIENYANTLIANDSVVKTAAFNIRVISFLHIAL